MPGQLSGMIIVAQPGRMLASFRVLVKSLFPTLSIEQTEDVSAVIPRLAGAQPQLVLIDADLPGDACWRLGEAIRKDHPRHHALILMHSARQCDRAGATGLDALLLEGMTAARLSAAMGVFLPD
jgi:DNA-binding NarL/FixJ family response regulator